MNEESIIRQALRITGEGSIRKVDADDPTKGLAGAIIKIEGVDNSLLLKTPRMEAC